MPKTRSVFFVLIVMMVSVSALFLFAQEKKEKPKTAVIEGTLVDLKCYAAGGYLTNDHGEMDNCGTMCAKGGLPVAIVDKDKNVHFLAVSAPGYADWVGAHMRLTGMHGKNAQAAFIPKKIEMKDGDKWVEKKVAKTMM